MSKPIWAMRGDGPMLDAQGAEWGLVAVVISHSYEHLGIQAGDVIFVVPQAPCRIGDLVMIRTENGHAIQYLDGSSCDVVGRVILVNHLQTATMREGNR